MRNHQIKFVDNQAWPGGVDWFLANKGDDDHHLFIREGACLPTVLSEAWAAFHESHLVAVRRRHRVLAVAALVAASAIPTWPAAHLLMRRFGAA
jgi:hypothetical protein